MLCVINLMSLGLDTRCEPKGNPPPTLARKTSQVADMALAPLRFLCKGRLLRNPECITSEFFDLQIHWVALAILAVVPATIIGIALRVASLLSAEIREEFRRNYKLNLCATTLENALQECFPNIEQSEITAKLLLGGLSTDEKYIVTVDNQKYVLRLYEPTENSKIDSELYMLNLASQLGIGPKIYYVAKDKSFVLMEFLEGGTLTFDQVRTPEACVSVAKAIKILHSSPTQEWIHYDCLALYKDSYDSLVNKAGKKPEFDEAINMMRDAYTELNKLSIQKVNTHSDLNPRNIFIINGQAKFIDWGDVNYHDPFYDLAFFSMITAYTPELEKLLLQTYLGREIEITDWQKFHHSKLIAYSTVILCAFNICFASNSSAEMIDDHLSYEILIKQFADNSDSSHSFLMNLAHTLLREGRKLKAAL